MLVLAIDTSSAAVTAGIVEDGTVVAEAVVHNARGHGELLAGMIERALAGRRPADIDAIVAGLGPGPFTGLRVGLVTAAAMGDALGVPTYGVCSLDGIGAGLAGAVLVVTDARRREVYWAHYRDGVRIAGPGVARPAAVPVEGVESIAGAGVDLYPGVWSLPRVGGSYPAVGPLVSCAGESSSVLTPLYLRRPDAVEPGAPKQVGT